MDEVTDPYYLKAFHRLNSSRLFELGPIPYAAIFEYGLLDGLERDNIELLIDVIQAVDKEFLEWSHEELDRQRKISSSNSKSSSGGRETRSADVGSKS